MRQIKLSGREMSVLKAIDFSNGTDGQELLERTRLSPDDLVDILDSLMGPGFVEPVPFAEKADVESLARTTFEVNPSYAQQLRDLMIKRH